MRHSCLGSSDVKNKNWTQTYDELHKQDMKERERKLTEMGEMGTISEWEYTETKNEQVTGVGNGSDLKKKTDDRE